MREHLENWRDYEIKVKGVTQSTFDSYERAVEQFINFMEGNDYDTSPRKVTPELIAEFIKWLFHNGATANGTRAQRLSAIRNYFSFLMDKGIVDLNVALRVPLPKIETKEARKFDTRQLGIILTSPEQNTPMGLRDAALLMIAYAGALRKAELLSLTLSRVTDSGRHMTLLIKGKGRKERSIKIRTTPAAWLRRWLSYRVTVDTGHEFIFISLKGGSGALGDKSCDAILKKYAAMAGIKSSDAFMHKMRATGLTDLYDSGRDKCPHCGNPPGVVDVLDVMGFAGHKSVETTRRYIVISERAKRQSLPDRRFKEILKHGGDNAETE